VNKTIQTTGSRRCKEARKSKEAVRRFDVDRMAWMTKPRDGGGSRGLGETRQDEAAVSSTAQLRRCCDASMLRCCEAVELAVWLQATSERGGVPWRWLGSRLEIWWSEQTQR
jgi:hypothetical protein